MASENWYAKLNAKHGEHLADWPAYLNVRDPAGPFLGGMRVYSEGGIKHCFRRGKALAEQLKRDCPEGKRPAMLLTRRADAPLSAETAFEFVTIIDVGVDLGSLDLMQAYAARKAAATPEELAMLSDLHVPNIRAALRLQPERVAELRSLLEEFNDVTPALDSTAATDPRALADMLSSAERCDAATFDALLKFIRGVLASEDHLAILRNLMASPQGAADGGIAFADALEERLKHLEGIVNTYLTTAQGGTETDMQRALEASPWILSLDHAKIWPKGSAGRGTTDFYAQRYDGVVDIIELKGPGEQLMVRVNTSGPGSPHEYALGPKVNNAIAQVIAYKIQADLDNVFADVHTSPLSRLYVVVGCVEPLEASDRAVFDEYRRSLHGIQVIGYDEVGNAALQRIASVRDCLKAIKPD